MVLGNRVLNRLKLAAKTHLNNRPFCLFPYMAYVWKRKPKTKKRMVPARMTTQCASHIAKLL